MAYRLEELPLRRATAMNSVRLTKSLYTHAIMQRHHNSDSEDVNR